MPEELDLIKAIGTRFIQRRDCKAVQGELGGDGEFKAWQPVVANHKDVPFKLQDFQDHLAGRRTFGHYLVDPDGNCKLFAFDIDLVGTDRQGNPAGELVDPQGDPFPCNPRELFLDPSHWARPILIQELRCMAEGLARKVNELLGISVAVHYSGNKGMHVYGFTGETQAVFAREAAIGVLDSLRVFEAYRGESFYRHTHSYKNLSIEVFPKQDKLSNPNGKGNLMALPLGIHKTSGAKKMFLSTRGSLDVLEEFDPMRALSGDLPWE